MPDEASAKSRSWQEARDRGCDPDATTQYWWSVATHDGEWCLEIDDPDVPFLSESESRRVKEVGDV